MKTRLLILLSGMVLVCACGGPRESADRHEKEQSKKTTAKQAIGRAREVETHDSDGLLKDVNTEKDEVDKPVEPQSHDQPMEQAASTPDKNSWPFTAAIPGGFTRKEHRQWKGQEIWILQGKTRGSVTETLLVVRGKDIPRKGPFGKSATVAVWTAELAANIPIGSSNADDVFVGTSSSLGKNVWAFLGDPSSPPPSVTIKPIQSNGTSPVSLSSVAGVAQEGTPSWLLVGGATFPDEKSYGSICQIVEDFCSALKE